MPEDAPFALAASPCSITTLSQARLAARRAALQTLVRAESPPVDGSHVTKRLTDVGFERERLFDAGILQVVQCWKTEESDVRQHD